MKRQIMSIDGLVIARLLDVGGGGKAKACHHMGEKMSKELLKEFNRAFLWYLAGKPIEQRVALMRECKEDLRKLGLEATVEKWRTILT